MDRTPPEPAPEDAPTIGVGGSASVDPDSDPTIDSGRVSTAAAAGLPATIGRYRVLAKLGQGGMGVVFEAEQQDPKRRVALKVIRGGTYVDDTQVRMFKREADTLALLKHPGIGGIYEAGRTDAGEHFFAMELVRGEQLSRYLRARKGALDATEIRFRLRLFLAICSAVHYAHQRGVIHRDLKPSNIMVSESEAGTSDSGSGSLLSGLPVVKVLDFGLARITGADVEAATAVSEVGVIKGTLPYMSPEQARGDSDHIDLRSDVYALGVILYEMLTGKRPLDLQSVSIAESVRVICEQPPMALRQAWSGTQPPDADLQTIVGKALEKDADRRYSSAAALADDVERFLGSRTILARAPSARYQLQKFAQRNRTLVAGIAATLVALVAGIVATTTFGLREAAQRRAAEQAQLDTRAVVEFQTNMLAGIDAELMGRRLASDLESRLSTAITEQGGTPAQVAAALAAFQRHMARINTTDAAMRVIDQNILTKAIATAAEQFADRPAIHAQILSSIGDTYSKLGLYAEAEPPLLTARALTDSALGADSAPALLATRQLATLYTAQGRVDEAEPLYLKVLSTQRRAHTLTETETIHTMNDLAVMLTDANRFPSADSLFQIAYAQHLALTNERHPYTLTLLGNHAWALTMAQDFARAESMAVRVLALRREVYGDRHTETLQSLNNLGVLYMQSDRPQLAEPLYREEFETSREVLGEEHPEVLVSMTNLGRLLVRQQKFAEAEAVLAKSLALTRRAMPPGFIGIGITVLAHGEALIGLGRFAEAERDLLEGYRIHMDFFGDPANGGVQRATQRLVEVYEKLGRPAQAATWRAKLKPRE